MVTTLEFLELKDPVKLKCVSGICDLTNLVKLKIHGCSELEELPGLAHLSCLERVEIWGCENLRCLELDDCANLKTVDVSDLPELKELSCLHGLGFLETVRIDRCKKLQNIAGIEKFPVLKDLHLSLCSNKAIRNSIHRLQRVPSEYLFCIGSAAEGAEAMLSSHLFSDQAAIELVVRENKAALELPILSFFRGAALSFLDTSFSAIILCAVLAIQSTAEINIYIDLEDPCVQEKRFRLDSGKWVFCAVCTKQTTINRHIANPRHPCIQLTQPDGRSSNGEGAIEKAYMVMVKKGQEWKSLNVMKKISDQLLEERRRMEKPKCSIM